MTRADSSPAGAPPTGLQIDDVWVAARLCDTALRPLAGADWSQPAAGLTWECRETLEHVAGALDNYSRYLALPTDERMTSLRNDQPDLPTIDLLRLVQMRAAVLVAVATAAPPTVRSFHVFGRADREAYLAMACAELLLHTDDVARGLGAPLDPPADLCRRTLARLFPWAPADAEPWPALRWATGRQSLPGRADVPPDWAWHAAPLAEWDGEVKTRGSYQGMRRP